MATDGPNIAGAGANDTAVGTVQWINPGNITANDTAWATAGSTTATSNYLKATSFGFDVPAGATINGVEIAINRYSNRSGTRYVVDNIAKLVVGGTITGNSKADTVNQWSVSNATVKTYGASDDTWGASLTPDNVNASDFGFALSVSFVSSTLSTIVSVNYIVITVTYTEGGGAVVRVPRAPAVYYQNPGVV